MGGSGKHRASTPFRKVMKASGVPVVAATTRVTDKANVRRECIVGLRRLAELREEQPYIPASYDGNHQPINVFGRALETAGPLRTHAGCPAAVILRDEWTTWRPDGVAVQVSVPVEQASERVATGTYRIDSETHEQVEPVLDERRQPARAEGGAR